MTRYGLAWAFKEGYVACDTDWRSANLPAARGDLAAAGPQQLHGLGHGREPHVRGEEGLLHRLQRGRVERPPAAHEVLDGRREHLARAGEPAAQPFAQPH